MIKIKLTKLISLLVAISTLSGCDAWSIKISVKQSIHNLSSDTIVVTNAKNEFRGIVIADTIICFPYSETVFFDATLHNQPLEPYDMPYISQDAIINTSSKRNLTKDISDYNNWKFDKQKRYEYLQFTITEDDLE